MTPTLPASLVLEAEFSNKIHRLSIATNHAQPSLVIEEDDSEYTPCHICSSKSSDTTESAQPIVSERTARELALPAPIQPANYKPSAGSTVNSHSATKTTGQHANWRRLSEKPLWLFFAKIREIHNTYPDNESIKTLYLEIKREFFERYLPDTMKIARNYFFKKMPKSSLLDQEDLEDAVQIEMWKYLDKFNPEFGTITFMQFYNARGNSRLTGSIVDRLRELQDCTRPIAQKRRDIRPMLNALAFKLRHRPTPEEFCDEYGWDTVYDEETGETFREVITDRLFWSGVFNQRRTATDLDGMNDEELESLATQESRPSKNLNRMQGQDSKQYILSFIEDEWINFIIDCYIWQNDTDKQICLMINQAGRRCSASWVSNKRKEGLRILEERLGLKKLKMLAYGREEE